MRVLLDTAVFVFAIEAPHRLSKRAYSVLKEPKNIRELSSVSLTEIAVKASLGKLNISASDARQALEDMDIRILPFTADHGFSVFNLPSLHGDPFDRQIIAQALHEQIPVVTPDAKFGDYDDVRVIW